MTRDWLTIRDVAEMIGIARNTLKRIPPRELPFMRVGRRGDRRYRVADVEAYIEGKMVRD